MGLKCPSCGFEAPDEAVWCDFCKHPFRKEKPAPASPSPAAPPPAPSPALMSVLEGLPKELAAKVPARLDGAVEEEKVPTLDPRLKTLAWAFLAFWFLLLVGLLGALVSRERSLETRPLPPAEPPLR